MTTLTERAGSEKHAPASQDAETSGTWSRSRRDQGTAPLGILIAPIFDLDRASGLVGLGAYFNGFAMAHFDDF